MYQSVTACKMVPSHKSTLVARSYGLVMFDH